MRKSQDILKEFARDVLIAIEKPEENYWFTERVGLCFNLREWARDKNKFHYLHLPRVYNVMRRSFLKYSLHKDKVSSPHPFNKNHHDHYNECLGNRVYKNKRRLAWLKDKAK